MAKEPAGVPLADFIGALRAELRTAALAKDPQLQFNVGPVSVEFTLMTHSSIRSSRATVLCQPISAELAARAGGPAEYGGVEVE